MEGHEGPEEPLRVNAKIPGEGDTQRREPELQGPFLMREGLVHCQLFTAASGRDKEGAQ